MIYFFKYLIPIDEFKEYRIGQQPRSQGLKTKTKHT